MKDFIINALNEDMPNGDITTDNLIDDKHMSIANFIAKDCGIISGIEYIDEVFSIIGGFFKLNIYKQSGEKVLNGDIIASIEGSTKTILKGERLVLNIIQYMSGIATLTNKYVGMVVGDTKILDTRKTTPNMRFLAKKAVIDGGGTNHRFNLSDMVMIKDNHIKAAGSITNAVNTIKKKTDKKIEVEIESIKMFEEALKSKCDIILLDNLGIKDIRKCIALNKGLKKLEASGNMTLDRIKEVSSTGVDYISVGALTHSFSALDISLKFI